MVAASKLRRAQQNAVAARPYSTRMTEVVASLAAQDHAGPAEPEAARRHGQGRHPSDHRRDRRPRPCRRVQQQHRPRRPPQGRGARGARARRCCSTSSAARAARCSSASIPKAIIAQYDTSEMKAPTYADAQAIAKDIIDRYTTDGIDVVHLAYANFRSTLVQEPTVDQIIPVAPRGAPTTPRQRRRRSPRSNMSRTRRKSSPTCCRATSRCRSIARCSRTRPASTASQMTAMDNATRNAGDMIKKLSISLQPPAPGGDHDRTDRDYFGRRGALTVTVEAGQAGPAFLIGLDHRPSPGTKEE